MGRTRPRPFRPALDTLEGRLVLAAPSASPVALAALPFVAALPSPTVPTLKASTHKLVLSEIDGAFSAYKGKNEDVLNALDVLSSLFTTPNSASTTTDSTDKGDGAVLGASLTKAVDRLPFGHSRAEPLIFQVIGQGGVTPGNSNFFRDRLKALVEQYVRRGVRNGDFTLTRHA